MVSARVFARRAPRTRDADADAAMSRATTTGVVLDVRGDDVDARRESSPRATSYAPDGSATREDASSAELSRPRSNRAPSTTRAGRLWDTMLDPDATRRPRRALRARERGRASPRVRLFFLDGHHVRRRPQSARGQQLPMAVGARERRHDRLVRARAERRRPGLGPHRVRARVRAHILPPRVPPRLSRQPRGGAMVGLSHRVGRESSSADASSPTTPSPPSATCTRRTSMISRDGSSRSRWRRSVTCDERRGSIPRRWRASSTTASSTRCERARRTAPLYCASRMREAVTRMTREPDPNAPRPSEEWRDRVRWERARMHWSLAAALNARMTSRIDALVGHCGAQERIRATRLTIVYVTHLRTFLMGYLLSLPFVFVRDWGWGNRPRGGVACRSRCSASRARRTSAKTPFRCVLHPRPPSPSGSTFDRVPFQLTDDHILYGNRPRQREPREPPRNGRVLRDGEQGDVRIPQAVARGETGLEGRRWGRTIGSERRRTGELLVPNPTRVKI